MGVIVLKVLNIVPLSSFKATGPGCPRVNAFVLFLVTEICDLDGTKKKAKLKNKTKQKVAEVKNKCELSNGTGIMWLGWPTYV